MGKCHSRENSEPREETIELEKTLQLYLNEKEDYKTKYESINKKYKQMRSQLLSALKTIKDLKRQLSYSEEQVTSLYLRYAIESDLNRRLKQSQNKLKEEKERLEKYQRELVTSNRTDPEIMERLRQFEERIYLLECRSNDVKFYKL